jgi:hypothetical protein
MEQVSLLEQIASLCDSCYLLTTTQADPTTRSEPLPPATEVTRSLQIMFVIGSTKCVGKQ